MLPHLGDAGDSLGAVWEEVVGRNAATRSRQHDDTGTLSNGTASGPSSSGEDLTIEPASRTFELAGTYRLGVSFKDTDPPPRYHVHEARWATPGVGTFYVPACAHLIGGARPNDIPNGPQVNAIVAGQAYAELAEVKRPSQPQPEATFYSGRHAIGVRGGPILATAHASEILDTWVAACSQDQVVHYLGHGTATALELIPGQVTVHVQNVPAMAQARFAMLKSCHSIGDANGNPDGTIGHAMVTQGCPAVVGWKTDAPGRAIGPPPQVIPGPAEWLDTRVWELLTKGELAGSPMDVAHAVAQARQEWLEANDPELVPGENAIVEAGSWFLGSGDAALQPAF